MNEKKSAVWVALWVLFAINTLNFFDRQILGAVGEPIRKEFGLSDSALGAQTRFNDVLNRRINGRIIKIHQRAARAH